MQIQPKYDIIVVGILPLLYIALMIFMGINCIIYNSYYEFIGGMWNL